MEMVTPLLQFRSSMLKSKTIKGTYFTCSPTGAFLFATISDDLNQITIDSVLYE